MGKHKGRISYLKHSCLEVFLGSLISSAFIKIFDLDGVTRGLFLNLCKLGHDANAR